MEFKSAYEMKKAVMDDIIDLYNPNIEEYVFCYSDMNEEICTYNLTPKEAQELAEEAGKENYWGGLLGPGGWILEGEDVENYFEKHYNIPGWEVADHTYKAA